MFDFGFGLDSNPFSFGVPVFGLNTDKLPSGIISGKQETSVPAGTPWWQSVFTFGADIYKSTLNYKLGSQQVKANQYPSQNALGNLGANTGNLASFLPLLIVIVVVFVLFRALFGGKRK